MILWLYKATLPESHKIYYTFSIMIYALRWGGWFFSELAGLAAISLYRIDSPYICRLSVYMVRDSVAGFAAPSPSSGFGLQDSACFRVL